MNNKLDCFSHRIPGLSDEKTLFRSAVCIPLIETENGDEIVFEIRSSRIPDQPGDVCLPGGKIENVETAEAAAVRELCEELLVHEENVSVLGQADFFHQDNLIIYPYVVRLSQYDGSFSPFEVAKTFSVPVSFFEKNEPEGYKVDMIPAPGEDFPYERIRGGKQYKWRHYYKTQLFYHFGEINIWGITANIIHNFIEILKNENSCT